MLLRCKFHTSRMNFIWEAKSKIRNLQSKMVVPSFNISLQCNGTALEIVISITKLFTLKQENHENNFYPFTKHLFFTQFAGL
jgi:hypothetical protein